jgi:hypothetical protein
MHTHSSTATPYRNHIGTSTSIFLLLLVVKSLAATEEPVGSPAPASSSAVVASDEKTEFFTSKVLPILESRCFECHGDADVEAELHLTSRKGILTGGESGAAMVPGDPDRSLIIQAMRYESFQMPPRNKMPDEEIAIIAKWIQDGAEWPEEMESKAEVTKSEFPMAQRIASHWAWKKLAASPVPAVKDQTWPASDIDRFLLAKMEATELKPSHDADRRTIIRRLYLDLIGLPPTIEQQQRFFSDPAETSVAMEKVVDELLASPQFGERWARHWLDLMRYAETLGHEFDFPLPQAWQYRDYVIRAVNADVPYNQFVAEHIAGDLLESPRTNPKAGFNESIIATGFWYLCEDKHAPVDVKLEEALRVDNQIDVFGKTFLGLTISCARCHDHKFDAITAADYYALSGFLQSSRRRVEWLDHNHQNETLVKDLIAARTASDRAIGEAVATADSALFATTLAAAMRPEPAQADASRLTSGTSEASSTPSNEQTRKLRELLLTPAAKDLSHPLSLSAMIAQSPPEALLPDIISQWKTLRDTALKSLPIPASASAHGWVQTQKAEPVTIAADFRRGLPANWRVFGAAFGQLQSQVVREGDHASLRTFDPSGARASWSPFGIQTNTNGVSSAALSPQLRGQMHSPEFELTHPEIYIFAAGKNARVRLQIDGYVMNEFSELLFGGCRQPIDTDGQFRWIRIAGDVGRYLGHRCHLEFLDEADGWFAVREIRLANHQGEIPPTVIDVCPTNHSLILEGEISVETIVNQICDRLKLDPARSDLSLQMGLVSAEKASAMDQATAAWNSLTEKPQGGDPVLVMCDGSGEDEYVFIRGNHTNRGPFVARHMLTALDAGQPLAEPVTSGRRELVDRLLADDNPFPSRVMVNRVWQHLFGRGLVPTPDNFGVLGEAPSHPELLDHLALEFRSDGWSVKRLIKRLVMTRAYRLSSERYELADKKDPNNSLLTRFNVRRLQGEAIRDSILTISGRLDLTMYGSSVPVYLTNFMQGRGRPGESGPLDGAGRRSIYQMVRRNFLNPFMLTFDAPQPASSIGRRSNSNVPAQALMMLNNELVHEQSKVWAARLLKDVPDGGELLLKRSWQQAFAREPSADEVSLLTEFAHSIAADKNVVAEKALQDPGVVAEICHVVLNQKEFVFLE